MFSIRTLFFFLVLCIQAALAQNPATAVFPGAVASDQDLGVACNGSDRGVLTAPVTNSALTMSVSDGTKFCYPSYATINNETFKICSVSGNTLTICAGARGVHGAAVSHSAGAVISAYIDQNFVNQSAAEIKAIEKSALANGGVSVLDKGAFGNGSSADDTAFSAAFTSACAKTTGRMVVIPSPSVNYKLTTTYDIPCDGIEVVGIGQPLIEYTGTGSMWTSSLNGAMLVIHGLHVQGPLTASTSFLKMIGGGGTAITKTVLYDNKITNFGDVSTGSGGAILITADTHVFSAYDNIFDNAGPALVTTAPIDTLSFFNNVVSSQAGYGIDLQSGATGAAAVLIKHNSFTAPGTSKGAIRIGASIGVANILIRDNEVEFVSSITDSNSAVFDILGGTVTLDGNYCNPHSNANYCYWIDNAISLSQISNNLGVNYNTSNIMNGTGSGNWYANNGGGSPSTTYSNPTYPGILAAQGSNSFIPTMGLGCGNPVGGLQVCMPAVAYDTQDWGLATFTDAGNPARKLSLGYDGTREVGYVQAIKSLVNVEPLALNPRGGGVSIGTGSSGGGGIASGIVCFMADAKTLGHCTSALSGTPPTCTCAQ